MKLSCETKEISAAVGAASKVVNAHTTVPILSNVLIQAENGSVSVRATDLELTLEQRVKAEIEEPGSITVPAKLFAGYLANLTQTSKLDLSGTPNRVSVKCERTNYDFNALPGEEYPPLPAAVKGAQFSLSGKRLREGIDAVIFAAATEEARGAVMMGTLLEIEGDKLTMVATDGYRLARYETTLDESPGGHERFIVPSRALAETARNLSGAERVSVNVLGAQNNQLQFSAENAAVTVRLVDGQYPNYQQVIPAKFDRKITASVPALLGALRRAELVAGDRASMVKMNLSNQTLIVTANSERSGNAYEEIEIEQEGDDLTIAFNARYMIEVLNHVKSAQCRIEFVGPLSPAALTPAEATEGASQLYVLMPLRQ